MTNPINYYKGSRDYYSRKDPHYSRHIEEIETHERINSRIDASSGDCSYSVIITKKDVRS